MPVIGYDAESICYKYDRKPFAVGWRLNSLGFPLLGWYLGLLIDQARGVEERESVQRKRGKELRELLVRSGSVALIKSGQALSLRPDLLRNKIWAEELGKLVDAVGSFNDFAAMDIIRKELSDILPTLKAAQATTTTTTTTKTTAASTTTKTINRNKRFSRLQAKIDNDPILSLFEFTNDNHAIASASIGQVYKARLKPSPMLDAVLGKTEASKWQNKIVAVKVQRPNAANAASLDMYLIRRAAMWLSKFRGGDLPAVADQFGMQLFGELDYVREADNCERFREVYEDWDDVVIPEICIGLTRRKVLVMEWVEGTKGPWEREGMAMVRIGLRCSVDQLLHTGLFHADPHRGNLLKTPDSKLAFIDFGMMADVAEEERYGLIGLCIGLQNKDLALVTDNLLKLGFLKDTTQLDKLVPRLRSALLNSTRGTGRASDVNFAQLQAELDNISREQSLQFRSPPFFTIIIRSLTILEGLALSVDDDFRLVRGAYPYVLKQLLNPDENEVTATSLRNLLVRLLTVDGQEKRIDWERLREFLQLAQKATKSYDPSRDNYLDDKGSTISRQTIELFFKFLTSKTGLFLKRPLVHELAQAIDGMASTGEANLLRISRGLIRPLPGGNGPVDSRRMKEIQGLFEAMVQTASKSSNDGSSSTTTTTSTGNTNEGTTERMKTIMELLKEMVAIMSDRQRRQEMEPVLAEVSSVSQMVAVEILEIRGSRAMRNVLRLDAF